MFMMMMMMMMMITARTMILKMSSASLDSSVTGYGLRTGVQFSVGVVAFLFFTTFKTDSGAQSASCPLYNACFPAE